MTPAAEKLWREVVQRAGRSDAIPSVRGSAISEVLSVRVEAVESALCELTRDGALVPLTDGELQKVACGKRIAGRFLRWEGFGIPCFYRVIDNGTLRQTLQAATAALQRELAALTQ